MIGGLDDLARQRTLRRWTRVTESAEAMDPATLANLRDQASHDRAVLDRAIAKMDGRLAGSVTNTAPQAPRDSDWVWRPDVFSSRMTAPGHAGIASGTALGDSVKMFHDCPVSEISLRQTAGRAYSASAPYGIAFDVLNFAGSFLSLVVELPKEAVEGLTLSHVVHALVQIEAESEIEVYARLNVKHGPNTEQVVRELDMRHSTPEVDFDLAYTDIAEPRIESAWLDIIFGNPRMNRVVLRDLIVSRHLRAEM
ncbi:hypothetical protein PARPLA_00106 [Rhodobacteraceae bacterium THAF1]|nr:hypothetical protein FIU81_00100 [Palleronia sp. THAF1]VDC16766.1 hypothetical protein PARPLA_00106 [Rhodobacteraceae bacterium THAF1]